MGLAYSLEHNKLALLFQDLNTDKPFVFTEIQLSQLDSIDSFSLKS